MCVKPRMDWNQHSTALDAQPLQIQVSGFMKYNVFSCEDKLGFLQRTSQSGERKNDFGCFNGSRPVSL